MIVNNSQLTPSQLDDFELLKISCIKYDQDLPTLYPALLTEKRSVEGNFLYYRDGVLIGFLAIYFFYKSSCEISLLVAPTFRRQGIGRQLLKQAL